LDKGYIYFAMAFAIAVEMLNIAFRRKRATMTAQPA
jgi:predicted tellurium resistance membrane protein TerC